MLKKKYVDNVIHLFVVTKKQGFGICIVVFFTFSPFLHVFCILPWLQTLDEQW